MDGGRWGKRRRSHDIKRGQERENTRKIRGRLSKISSARGTNSINRRLGGGSEDMGRQKEKPAIAWGVVVLRVVVMIVVLLRVAV